MMGADRYVTMVLILINNGLIDFVAPGWEGLDKTEVKRLVDAHFAPEEARRLWGYLCDVNEDMEEEEDA